MVDSVQAPTSYRQHLNRGVRVGPCTSNAKNVNGTGITGLIFIIFGISDLVINGDINTVDFIFIGIGALFLISFTVTHCIAYNSYTKTTVINPEHPPNPYLPSSSTPYMGSSSPSVSAPPAYKPGPGFSHDHDLSTPKAGSFGSYPPPPPYAPGPGFSAQCNSPSSSLGFGASATSPPPPQGFSGKQGVAAYPPLGFSGQPGIATPPSGQPGIAPTPYDLSTPFAPTGSIFSYS